MSTGEMPASGHSSIARGLPTGSSSARYAPPCPTFGHLSTGPITEGPKILSRRREGLRMTVAARTFSSSALPWVC